MRPPVCGAECERFPALCDLDQAHDGRHSTDGHPWGEAPASTPREPAADLIRWHYSLAEYLSEIRAACALRALPGSLTPPAVWFSSNDVIEATARGCYSPAKMPPSGEMMRYGVGPSFALEHWPALKTWVGPRTVERLELAAELFGAVPAEWWISRRRVPLKALCAIEVWRDGAWVDVDFRTAKGTK